MWALDCVVRIVLLQTRQQLFFLERLLTVHALFADLNVERVFEDLAEFDFTGLFSGLLPGLT